MRRSMVLAVSAVVLFSMAVGLISASVLLDPLPTVRPAAGLSEENTAVVRQFYDAANDVIATGSVEALHAVVAPHFVEQDPLQSPNMQPGRAGLEDYLVALHAMTPDMQLVAESMVADEERVMARVAVQGVPATALSSGTVIGQSTPWGPVDVFRLSGGKIVERWSHTDGVALVRPLAEGSMDLAVPSPRVMTMKRLRISAGDRWSSSVAGPQLLYLEEGALRVDIASPLLAAHVAEARGTTAGPGWASPQATTLSVGRSLVVSSGARVEATNVGTGVVQVLVVTFDVPQTPGGAPPEPESLPPGVVAQTLAGGLVTDVPMGAAVLVLQQITLAHTAWFSVAGAKGPTLLAVESGRLAVEARGTVWVRRGTDGISIDTDEALLNADDGLLVHPGSLAMLHDTDGAPAVALVLTLRPGPVSGPAMPVT